jgi:hypothetical protein
LKEGAIRIRVRRNGKEIKTATGRMNTLMRSGQVVEIELDNVTAGPSVQISTRQDGDKHIIVLDAREAT